MKIHKTNACRELDKFKISYEIVEYEVDLNDLSAKHVAEILNQDINLIYKTIVCTSDYGYVVACIRGDLELDLKALAIANKCKKCELLSIKDLEKITGYVRGGCSPLAMKKKFPTFIDDLALKCDKIYISAGVRGKQIFINPKDLAIVANATFSPLSRKIN